MWRLLKHALHESRPSSDNADVAKTNARTAAATLLSTMADQGTSDVRAAEDAYAAAWDSTLASGFGRRPTKPSWTKASLASALKSLESTSADAKKHVLEGMAFAGRRDGVLVLEELELLRTVAILLGTPIPPPRLP